MVIAVIALCFSIAGTGLAAVGALSKQEKKQVRKIAGTIADKRIKQRASGLTVSSAGSAKSADSAKVAASATFADSAKVAGDVSNQLWAIVNADGTLLRGTPGILGSEQEATGRYLVFTDRSVSNCYFVASLGGGSADLGLTGDISANPVSINNNAVYVRTGDNSGSNSSRPFTLLIRC
jgi:hypothetical protein